MPSVAVEGVPSDPRVRVRGVDECEGAHEASGTAHFRRGWVMVGILEQRPAIEPVLNSLEERHMNKMGKRVAVIGATMGLLAVPVAASADGHFAGPVFKLGSTPNGDILAADAGAGIAVIDDGELGATLPAPGATSVAAEPQTEHRSRDTGP